MLPIFLENVFWKYSRTESCYRRFLIQTLPPGSVGTLIFSKYSVFSTDNKIFRLRVYFTRQLLI